MRCSVPLALDSDRPPNIRARNSFFGGLAAASRRVRRSFGSRFRSAKTTGVPGSRASTTPVASIRPVPLDLANATACSSRPTLAIGSNSASRNRRRCLWSRSSNIPSNCPNEVRRHEGAGHATGIVVQPDRHLLGQRPLHAGIDEQPRRRTHHHPDPAVDLRFPIGKADLGQHEDRMAISKKCGQRLSELIGPAGIAPAQQLEGASTEHIVATLRTFKECGNVGDGDGMEREHLMKLRARHVHWQF